MPVSQKPRKRRAPKAKHLVDSTWAALWTGLVMAHDAVPSPSNTAALQRMAAVAFVVAHMLDDEAVKEAAKGAFNLIDSNIDPLVRRPLLLGMAGRYRKMRAADRVERLAIATVMAHHKLTPGADALKQLMDSVDSIRSAP